MAYQRWRRRVHAVTVFATESSDEEAEIIVEGDMMAPQECLSDNAAEYDAGYIYMGTYICHLLRMMAMTLTMVTRGMCTCQ